MADLIDREAFYKELYDLGGCGAAPDTWEDGWDKAIGSAILRLKEAPTIDAVPVVQGRWVDRYGGKYANSLYECSECKEPALYRIETDVLGKKQFVQALTSVCPNCEAKMDLEGE